MGVESRINFKCENKLTPEIEPTKCEYFHRKRRDKMSTNERVSCWDLNTKLLIATISMGMGAYEVSEILGICNLPNDNILLKCITKDLVIHCELYLSSSQ